MSGTIPSSLVGSPPFPGAVLLEVWDYGEGQTNDKEKNLRGQLHKIYDGAGLVEVTNYDFKGNPLQQIRTYTEDTTQHPDWTSIGSVNLETETYATATEYDALNRPVKLTTPDNGETNYTYDKGGLLKTVAVENVHSLDMDIVNNIEYNAKGQRAKVQYENGTTTTYQYDVFTFRVRRIRTTRHSDSKELQDLRYWYDPVGNITLQKDLAQQTVYFDGSVAEPHNDYTYDALYRLIQAAGREHAGNNNAPDYSDSSRRGITPTPIDSTDTAKMRRYIQYYEYDEAGNFIQMRHTVTGGTGNWTRYYTTANDSNRLEETVVGSGTPEVYTFDARGNIVSGFAHLVGLAFNAENRLEKVEIDANRTAYYQYDSKGQRVRKTIVDTNSNITEVRKYVGEWEVYSKYVSSSLTLERETLHISDDTGRIALIDTRTTGTGSEPAQLLRYQYSNHLGTATLELDDAGAIISYEEYYPYGSTSFQSGRSGAEVSLKRYKYCSCERDEETGLYSMGMRYYMPWLARWTAVDALQSEMPTWSSYNYGFCNPVKWKDSTGMQPENEEKGKSKVSPNTSKSSGENTDRFIVYVFVGDSAINEVSNKDLKNIIKEAKDIFKENELEGVVEIKPISNKEGKSLYEQWKKGDLQIGVGVMEIVNKPTDNIEGQTNAPFQSNNPVFEINVNRDISSGIFTWDKKPVTPKLQGYNMAHEISHLLIYTTGNLLGMDNKEVNTKLKLSQPGTPQYGKSKDYGGGHVFGEANLLSTTNKGNTILPKNVQQFISQLPTLLRKSTEHKKILEQIRTGEVNPFTIFNYKQ